jgi:FtsP/CotA-like multicopper oxidase with cupredoxin domain
MNHPRAVRPAVSRAILILFAWALCFSTMGSAAAQEELDPLTLTKYIDPLPIPAIAEMAGPDYYEIGAYKLQQQLHSELPPTWVYGYGTSEATASYPGPTIVAQKGVPISIRWTNHITGAHILDRRADRHARTRRGAGAAERRHADAVVHAWIRREGA